MGEESENRNVGRGYTTIVGRETKVKLSILERHNVGWSNSIYVKDGKGRDEQKSLSHLLRRRNEKFKKKGNYVHERSNARRNCSSKGD